MMDAVSREPDAAHDLRHAQAEPLAPAEVQGLAVWRPVLADAVLQGGRSVQRLEQRVGHPDRVARPDCVIESGRRVRVADQHRLVGDDGPLLFSIYEDEDDPADGPAFYIWADEIATVTVDVWEFAGGERRRVEIRPREGACVVSIGLDD